MEKMPQTQKMQNTRNTGDYDKDFGHFAEEMARNLFMDMPGFSGAELTSIYDDQKVKGKKIDIVAQLENGQQIAFQLSGTENEGQMIYKLKQLKDFPVITELHDDEGNIVDKKLTLRAVVGFDKVMWDRAFNDYIEGKSATMTSALPDERQIKIDLLQKTIASMKFAQQLSRTHASEYKKAIQFLTDVSLNQLEN